MDWQIFLSYKLLSNSLNSSPYSAFSLSYSSVVKVYFDKTFFYVSVGDLRRGRKVFFFLFCALFLFLRKKKVFRSSFLIMKRVTVIRWMREQGKGVRLSCDKACCSFSFMNGRKRCTQHSNSSIMAVYAPYTAYLTQMPKK